MVTKKRVLITVLTILLVVLVFCPKVFSQGKIVIAANAVLDLRNRGFDSDGILEVTGEYELYLNRTLLPEDFQNILPEVITPEYVNYHKRRGPDKPDKNDFTAGEILTLRLRINVSPTESKKALRFFDFGFPCRIFVNGINITPYDKTDALSANHALYIRNNIIAVEGHLTEIEIIIHAPSQEFYKYGPWQTITIGAEQLVREHQLKKNAVDLFFFGSLMIMALYHIGIFLLRRKERSPLYFAFACFFGAVYSITVGERFAFILFPSLNWTGLILLIYFSSFLMLTALMKFIQTLFPEGFNALFSSVLQVGVLIALGILAIAPQGYYEALFTILYLLATIAFIYILFVIVKSTVRKEDGAFYFLTGFVVLFACGINDMLVQKDILDNGMYISMGLYFVIFSQALF